MYVYDVWCEPLMNTKELIERYRNKCNVGAVLVSECYSSVDRDGDRERRGWFTI